MAVICLRCNRSIEPLKVVEIAPKTEKKWLITRCPNERCNFNLDIDVYVDRPKTDKDKGRYLWQNYGRW